MVKKINKSDLAKSDKYLDKNHRNNGTKNITFDPGSWFCCPLYSLFCQSMSQWFGSKYTVGEHPESLVKEKNTALTLPKEPTSSLWKADGWVRRASFFSHKLFLPENVSEMVSFVTFPGTEGRLNTSFLVFLKGSVMLDFL